MCQICDDSAKSDINEAASTHPVEPSVQATPKEPHVVNRLRELDAAYEIHLSYDNASAVTAYIDALKLHAATLTAQVQAALSELADMTADRDFYMDARCKYYDEAITERKRADRAESSLASLEAGLAETIIRHGMATGHGDNAGDLLRELDIQVSEKREAWRTADDAAVRMTEKANRYREQLASLEARTVERCAVVCETLETNPDMDLENDDGRLYDVYALALSQAAERIRSISSALPAQRGEGE